MCRESIKIKLPKSLNIHTHIYVYIYTFSDPEHWNIGGVSRILAHKNSYTPLVLHTNQQLLNRLFFPHVYMQLTYRSSAKMEENIKITLALFDRFSRLEALQTFSIQSLHIIIHYII